MLKGDKTNVFLFSSNNNNYFNLPNHISNRHLIKICLHQNTINI